MLRKCTSAFLKRAFAPYTTRQHCPGRPLNTESSATEKARSRLFYQSKKRGILENDILIGGFADEHLSRMNAEELAKYDEMINGRHMEWDLYYYFTGKKDPPPDLATNPVFASIRKYVLTRRQPGKDAN